MAITLYPYPKLRITAKGARDHGQLVLRWMSRNALRYLRQVELAGMPAPTVEDLTTWLIEVSDAATEHYDHADIARKCAAGAEFSLDVYDPRFYDRKREAGRRGGSAGVIEVSDEDLLRVKALSHNEAARALNVSRSTVIRRRREFDPSEAELDLLFGVDQSTGEVIEIPETTTPTSEGWPPHDTGDIPAEWDDDPGIRALREAAQQDRHERLISSDMLVGVTL